MVEKEALEFLSEHFPDVEKEVFPVIIDLIQEQKGKCFSLSEIKEFFSKFRDQEHLRVWMFGILSQQQGPYQQIIRRKQRREI